MKLLKFECHTNWWGKIFVDDAVSWNWQGIEKQIRLSALKQKQRNFFYKKLKHLFKRFLKFQVQDLENFFLKLPLTFLTKSVERKKCIS